MSAVAPSPPSSRLFDRDAPSGRLDAIVLVVLSAVAALLLWKTWNTWMHPIIDSGRDLYLPEQLAKGKKLYRDFFYAYPPLAPYFLSLVDRIFGSSLFVYRILGIVLGVSVTAILYLLTRTIASCAAAFAATLMFLALNFVNMTPFGSNFVFPYSHAIVIGLFFYLLFELALVRLVMKPSVAIAILAASSAVAAAWCRIEFAAAAAIVLVVGGSILLWRRQNRIAVWLGSSVVLIAAATFAFASWYFSDTSGANHWLWGNILAPNLTGSRAAQVFHRHVDGTDELLPNLLRAISGAVLTIIAVILTNLADSRIRRRDMKGASVFALMLAVTAWLLTDTKLFEGWTILGPLAALILLVPALRRFVVERVGAEDAALLVLLLVSAAAVAPRIWLRLAPVWYGFAFVVPLYPLLVFVFLRLLPRARAYAQSGTFAWLLILGLVAFRGGAAQVKLAEQHRFPIETARGLLYDENPYRAASISQFLVYAREHPLHSLVVLPDGMTLNYFTQTETPLRWHSFSPDMLSTPSAEAAVIQQFEEKRPAHVVVTVSSASQFGYRGFGIDYGTSVAAYIHRHYVLEQRWPGLVLLRRES